MLGSPIPAFPTVRIPDLLCVSSQKFQQTLITSVGIMNDLGLAVPVGLREDGRGTVLPDDAPNLGDDQIRRFIPADPLVLAHAAILRIPFSIGVPSQPSSADTWFD